MGRQIIKQPDGRFAIFSSSTDTVHIWDATAEEIVDYFAEKAAEDARREARRMVDAVARDDARSVYYQFMRTWEEVLESDREHGGEVWREWQDRAQT